MAWAFAYWKVLKGWCVLRHDDHRGLDPTGWMKVPGGRVLELHRTKTTGLGKRVAVRPVGLSAEAYLVAPSWAQTGEQLWRDTAPRPRDHLLVGPEAGLEGAVRRELMYHEAAAWSRALYYRLCNERGLEEIKDHLGALFTEHSARHWLPSVSYALGAPETETEVLGGWSAKPSRAYLDTAAERMMNVQGQAARLLRSEAGGRDHVGEGRLLQQVACRLVERGHVAEKVNKELEEFNFYPLEATAARSAWSVQGGSQDSPATTAPPQQPKKVRRQADEDKAVPPQERGYVVSIGKSGFRRLHYAGACHRVPGVHYTTYEWIGVVLPQAGDYDAHCAKCWPEAPADQPVAGPPSRAVPGQPRVTVAVSQPVDELDEGAPRSEASEDDSSSTQQEG